MIKEYDLAIEYCPFCGDKSENNLAMAPTSHNVIFYHVCCSVCGSNWKEEMKDTHGIYKIKQIYKYGNLNKLKPEIALYVASMRGLKEKKGEEL